AIAGFSTIIASKSVLLALAAAIAGGSVMAALFGLLALTLRANQVASGLALTMFGLGLSALWGQGYSGLSAPAFPRLYLPGLTEAPLFGKLLFGQDGLVYFAVAILAAVAWVLDRTRLGLIVRAIGENHDAAHAIGYRVIAYRYLALMFGGAMAGLCRPYLSLVQTPLGGERVTAGLGSSALAQASFSTWRPRLALVGPPLFAGMSSPPSYT